MVELKIAFKVEALLSSESVTLPKTAKKTISQLSSDIVFDLCSDCYKLKRKMSSIPQGMFVAKKMRENQEKLTISRTNGGENVNSQKYFNTKLTELTPLKYNSKLMNSIWGLYNRYSPHNIKSTNDENADGGDLQRAAVANLQRAAAPKEAADGPGKAPKTPSPSAGPKLESFWSNIPISQSQ